jgi:hypothetical protein
MKARLVTHSQNDSAAAKEIGLPMLILSNGSGWVPSDQSTSSRPCSFDPALD